MAFGEGCCNKWTIFQWFEKLLAGNSDFDNQPRGCESPPVIDDDELC